MREAAVGRAPASVVAGRRAAVVGQRRIFVVIVAATSSTAAIVFEVEVDVRRTVDAAAVGPALVDEQRDGGRRQLVGADPAAVLQAADGHGPSALFRRVRFALLGHGPRDQYPGRSPRVAQYAPDERAAVSHRAPAAPVGPVVVGGRRVAPPDGRASATAYTATHATVEMDVRVKVTEVQSVGRTRGAGQTSGSYRGRRFTRLGQAHQRRPAAAEQKQRRGRRGRRRLAVAGRRGHRRQ